MCAGKLLQLATLVLQFRLNHRDLRFCLGAFFSKFPYVIQQYDAAFGGYSLADQFETRITRFRFDGFQPVTFAYKCSVQSVDILFESVQRPSIVVGAEELGFRGMRANPVVAFSSTSKIVAVGRQAVAFDTFLPAFAVVIELQGNAMFGAGFAMPGEVAFRSTLGAVFEANGMPVRELAFLL